MGESWGRGWGRGGLDSGEERDGKEVVFSHLLSVSLCVHVRCVSRREEKRGDYASRCSLPPVSITIVLVHSLLESSWNITFTSCFSCC